MDFSYTIVRKLYARRIIGHKHTAIEHVTKSLPKHIVGEAKKALNELIKEGIILLKKTSYGDQVSLNPDKLFEIEQILSNNSHKPL